MNGQWFKGRATMPKGTNEVWSVTQGPVAPGVWEYSFQVDGLTMEILASGSKEARERMQLGWAVSHFCWCRSKSVEACVGLASAASLRNVLWLGQLWL